MRRRGRNNRNSVVIVKPNIQIPPEPVQEIIEEPIQTIEKPPVQPTVEKVSTPKKIPKKPKIK